MREIDYMTAEERKKVDRLFDENRDAIMRIRHNGRCFGDQAREVMRTGITWNSIYARKLVEMAFENCR